jgi:hypothetical protein
MALPDSQTIDLTGNLLKITELELAGPLDVNAGTVTLSSNAGTITKYAAKITTESLTTAHTASATLTLTLAGVVAADLAFAQIAGGTNSAGLPVISKVVCTTNTVTITLTNYAVTTNAFNGTFIINLVVFKA